MRELHAEASTQLDRLFPNAHGFVPEGIEEEPEPEAGDDFGDDEPAYDRHEAHRVHNVVVAAGVPLFRFPHAPPLDLPRALATPLAPVAPVAPPPE